MQTSSRSPGGPPQSQPTPTFSEADLLSSVDDARVEMGDLDFLFSEGAALGEETGYRRKQEEREFNLDDTRRRTPLVSAPASQDVGGPSGRVMERVMEGTAPRAKMKSTRPRVSQ